MSKRVAYVVCRECGGTGIGEMQEDDDGNPTYRADCGWCMGQRHICIDLDLDGGIPDGWREWNGPKIGEIPVNPLRLTYNQSTNGKA